MTTWYRQCRFKSGDAQTVAWIEERFARKGNTMVFKDTDDMKRWEVDAVYENRRCEDDVKKHESDYKNQRKASDI